VVVVLVDVDSSPVVVVSMAPVVVGSVVEVPLVEVDPEPVEVPPVVAPVVLVVVNPELVPSGSVPLDVLVVVSTPCVLVAESGPKPSEGNTQEARIRRAGVGRRITCRVPRARRPVHSSGR